MRYLSVLLVLMAGAVLAGAARAQVETDPAKEYPIVPEAGPWLICATSYVGPQAPQLAHEMVLELRSRFHMPAYVLNRGDEERRKQEAELKAIKEKYDELNRLRQQYHEPEVAIPKRLMPRIQEQCAVLVGDFKDQDAAARSLKSFKKLPPPSNERLCPILTQVSAAAQPGEDRKLHYAYANPFANAFLVPNPTVPRQPRTEEKRDPFLKKLNVHEKYSLLKCNKQYTLLIAVFKGFHTFQSSDNVNESVFDKLWGGNTGEFLEASAQNAHNLAEVLRSPKLGLNCDVYVLHMREGSLVTIGGFDREDDPQIKGIEQALATRLKYERNHLQLLPQPLVMRVPRP